MTAVLLTACSEQKLRPRRTLLFQLPHDGHEMVLVAIMRLGLMLKSSEKHMFFEHKLAKALMVKKISGAFTGGAIGGLVDSFNIWLMGVSGISDLIGIGMKPEFKAPWLYERMVWGGLWMLLLIIPVLKSRVVLRGILFSLFPSAMMLFIVLPSMGKGMLGLGFGILMPAVVIGLNFIYGAIASVWYAKVVH